MEKLVNLGIDWKSILLYAVNFGLLFFILGRYLYKPVLKYIDERRGLIEGSINEANDLKKEIQKKQDEMEKKEHHLEQHLKEETEKLKKFTEEKRAELSKAMDMERARMLENTQAEIDRRMKEIMKEAEKKTTEVIKNVVMHIVHNKIPENVIEESIEEAWKVEVS